VRIRSLATQGRGAPHLNRDNPMWTEDLYKQNPASADSFSAVMDSLDRFSTHFGLLNVNEPAPKFLVNLLTYPTKETTHGNTRAEEVHSQLMVENPKYPGFNFIHNISNFIPCFTAAGSFSVTLDSIKNSTWP